MMKSLWVHIEESLYKLSEESCFCPVDKVSLDIINISDKVMPVFGYVSNGSL